MAALPERLRLQMTAVEEAVAVREVVFLLPEALIIF
jgi:hypothetical protein